MRVFEIDNISVGYCGPNKTLSIYDKAKYLANKTGESMFILTDLENNGNGNIYINCPFQRTIIGKFTYELVEMAAHMIKFNVELLIDRKCSEYTSEILIYINSEYFNICKRVMIKYNYKGSVIFQKNPTKIDVSHIQYY